MPSLLPVFPFSPGPPCALRPPDSKHQPIHITACLLFAWHSCSLFNALLVIAKEVHIAPGGKEAMTSRSKQFGSQGSYLVGYFWDLWCIWIGQLLLGKYSY